MRTNIARKSGLHTLPVELVAEIVKFTESLDLCALRLTCRAIYQSSLRQFAHNFVHTLRTDLSPNSLARVEEAANDEMFCPCVRKLEIVRDSKGYLGPLSPDAISKRIYIQAWCDVIKRLSNCRSFELHNLSYTTPYAYSHGITLDEATGLVLKAIANEQIPMEYFSISIVKSRTRVFQDKLTQFDIATFGIPAFSHLKELCFAIPDAETKTIHWMAKMIQCAKSLRKLTIIFNWKCESTFLLSQLSSAGCLPELQELTFSRMSFESSAALGIFLYSIQDSIRHVTFSFVQLELGGWRSILRELGGGSYQLDSVILHSVLEANGFLNFRKIPEYSLAEISLDKRLYHYGVWYGENEEVALNVIIVEAKKTDSESGVAQALGYMGYIPREEVHPQARLHTAVKIQETRKEIFDLDELFASLSC
ncbi:hypothetical protein CBS147332_477 [Penicillium roqueforti]|nr:hypothetical protein CBS147332_477 [Penicillium roqueforti]KAI3120719.1 hypothetical protein CBS147331_1938 [Penicillium roqueforti]